MMFRAALMGGLLLIRLKPSPSSTPRAASVRPLENANYLGRSRREMRRNAPEAIRSSPQYSPGSRIVVVERSDSVINHTVSAPDMT